MIIYIIEAGLIIFKLASDKILQWSYEWLTQLWLTIGSPPFISGFDFQGFSYCCYQQWSDDAKWKISEINYS